MNVKTAPVGSAPDQEQTQKKRKRRRIVDRVVSGENNCVLRPLLRLNTQFSCLLFTVDPGHGCSYRLVLALSKVDGPKSVLPLSQLEPSTSRTHVFILSPLRPRIHLPVRILSIRSRIQTVSLFSFLELQIMASLEAGRHSSYVVSIPLSEYQSLVRPRRPCPFG